MPPPFAPIVSIVVANRNGEKYLEDALVSALNQTLHNIEIIVIDDASSDSSLEIVHTLARRDDRIQLLTRTERVGPGGARNQGLAAARGRWIAIFDSDDLMHPSRLAQLVSEAEATDADLIADDLLIFQTEEAPTSLLSSRQRRLGWISAAAFISSNQVLSGPPALGYLKPLIRASFIRQHSICYRTDLMIGEDYDLVVQLLAKGAKFRLLDTLGYFYRKHPHSISHRLTGDNIAHMLKADRRLRSMFNEDAGDIAGAFAIRQSSIERAAVFSDIVAALKTRRWIRAGQLFLRAPRVAPLLTIPIAARLHKLRRSVSRNRTGVDSARICLIFQGCLNGHGQDGVSFPIAIARALKAAAHKTTFISPSLSAFTPYPALHLPLEMDVFESVHIRGTWRIGRRLLVRKTPIAMLAAMSAIVARIASKLGRQATDTRPYPQVTTAETWSRDDQLFIARHAPRNTLLVLLDATCEASVVPYTLAPSARMAVVTRKHLPVIASIEQEALPSQGANETPEELVGRILRSIGYRAARDEGQEEKNVRRIDAQNVARSECDGIVHDKLRE